jgi:hypothetical protein
MRRPGGAGDGIWIDGVASVTIGTGIPHAGTVGADTPTMCRDQPLHRRGDPRRNHPRYERGDGRSAKGQSVRIQRDPTAWSSEERYANQWQPTPINQLK